MRIATAVLGAALGATVSVAASADTLDFTEPGVTGLVGAATVALSNATLTSLDADFFIGAPGAFGETNGLGIACGAAADGSCEADWRIDFAAPVRNLSFASFAVAPGDDVTVSAYDGAAFLASYSVTTATTLDLSALASVTRLDFADSSTAAGIGFGDFRFDTDTDAAVPLPATLPLLVAGLAGLAAAGRRRPGAG